MLKTYTLKIKIDSGVIVGGRSAWLCFATHFETVGEYVVLVGVFPPKLQLYLSINISSFCLFNETDVIKQTRIVTLV